MNSSHPALQPIHSVSRMIDRMIAFAVAAGGGALVAHFFGNRAGAVATAVVFAVYAGVLARRIIVAWRAPVAGSPVFRVAGAAVEASAFVLLAVVWLVIGLS